MFGGPEAEHDPNVKAYWADQDNSERSATKCQQCQLFTEMDDEEPENFACMSATQIKFHSLSNTLYNIHKFLFREKISMSYSSG